MRRAERQAVFLDRDGTIIHDTDYPRDPEAVRLLPGAAEALARLQAQGFLLVVVSNQSGIGRGLVTAQQAEHVHRRVVACLAEQGVLLDAAYYCPHAPEDGCCCRKPSPELLWRAAEALGIDLTCSFLIGDKSSDIEAGQRAGCRTILLTLERPPQTDAPPPDWMAGNWPEVLAHILGKTEASA